MRLAIVLVGLAEWLGGPWADLNGDTYDWWTWSLRALGVVTLAVAFAPPPRVPAWCASLAVPVAIAAVAIQTQHFNDSFEGSRAWPDTLAVVFAGACLVATGYLRRGSDNRRRSRGRMTTR